MSNIFFASIETLEPSQLLTPSDRDFIDRHSGAHRRAEITAWRSLLRESLVELGYAEDALREIRYTENRAPYLVGSDLYFGVSHSRRIVAVIISDSPCAVDIEDYTRNFSVVARRFTTPEEISVLDVEEESMVLPILWSAKETLYKISGRSSLDLIRDLEVVGQEGDRLFCRVCYVDEYELRYMTYDGHVVVTTL